MPRRSKTATFQGRPLLGNHQKSWLWGTVTVWETLSAGRWPIYELLISPKDEHPLQQRCVDLARSHEIPIREVNSSRLEQLAKARDHQGILALMGPFPYRTLSQCLTQVQLNDVWLMLDRLQDPHNFGAIVRSAAGLGCGGILIGRDQQIGVNSHVARASAGIVNRVPICRTDDLTETLTQLHAASFVSLAATMDAAWDVRQVRQQPQFCDRPLVIIIGNEATGVAPELLAQATSTVSIPLQNDVESLNAAVAAGILMFSLNAGGTIF